MLSGLQNRFPLKIPIRSLKTILIFSVAFREIAKTNQTGKKKVVEEIFNKCMIK
jgi:hypothetical protein